MLLGSILRMNMLQAGLDCIWKIVHQFFVNSVFCV